MKLIIPYLIQDPGLSAIKLPGNPIEKRTFEREEFCLDGPISKRVAVLDFNPDTGDLNPGIPFVAPSEDRDYGSFKLSSEDDPEADDFLPVNVFATVLATLYMYEEKDALGREVEWAFGSPQLLVVPRAGEWANAFYQRESRSLQFFYFPAHRGSSRSGVVYTGLSQDIIAHETAHAILDGVAPDLYNSLTPQSLAIHEAVADITALLSSLRSSKLRQRLLEDTHGSISGKNAYSRIAEQFGFERDHSGRSGHLRSLWNERTLDPEDQSLDELNRRNLATRAEPHLLSEVLSGALYRVLAHLHEEYKSRRAAEKNITEYSASGWALFVAREHFKRLVLRSLDYLPPGEVSFADYGRAILASDQASYEDHSEGRDKLVEVFVHRHVVTNTEDLLLETNFHHATVAELDLDVLVSSDWAAYDFVEGERDFFGIPANVNFRVYPRLKAEKEYRTRTGFEMVTECIVKISWDRVEDNPRDLPLPALRQITVGTTLVIDWHTRRVRALLVSDAAKTAPPGQAEPAASRQQRLDRDELLRQLVWENRLAFGPEGIDEPEFESAARAEVSGDVLRIRGSGRMLHLTQGDGATDKGWGSE